MNKSLLNFLYDTSTILFYGSILIFALAFVFNILTDDAKIGSFQASKFDGSFQMPFHADLSISGADEVLFVEHHFEGSRSGPAIRNLVDALVMEEAQIIKAKFESESAKYHINLKSDIWYHNLLFATYNFLKLLFWFSMLYLIMKGLKKLRKGGVYFQSLQQTVNRIGAILIVYPFIQLILQALAYKIYFGVEMKSFNSDGLLISDQLFLVNIGIDLQLIFFGLLLILLGQLLKYGHQLQEENQFTV